MNLKVLIVFVAVLIVFIVFIDVIGVNLTGFAGGGQSNVTFSSSFEKTRGRGLPKDFYICNKQDFEEKDYADLYSDLIVDGGYIGKALQVNLSKFIGDFLYSKTFRLDQNYSIEFYIKNNFTGEAEIRIDYFDNNQILSESGIRFNNTSLITCEGSTFYIQMTDCNLTDVGNNWKRASALIGILNNVTKGRIYIAAGDGVGLYLLDEISVVSR